MGGPLTRSLLEALNPAVLGELAQTMRAKAAKYAPEQSQFAQRLRFPGGGEEWTGQASDALKQRAGGVGRIYGSADHILTTTADQLAQAQGFVADSKSTALQFVHGVEDKDVALGTNDGKMWNCGKPFHIAEDFTVQVKPDSVPTGAPYQIREFVQMMAAEFTEDTKRLVHQLEDLGTTWAGKIQASLDLSHLALDSKGQPYAPYDATKAVREQAAAIANGTVDVPSDPKELHDLWEQLTPTEKDAIYQRHKDIGNHNGIPMADRDHYNRMHLPVLEQEAKDTLEQLKRQHSDWSADRPPGLHIDPKWPQGMQEQERQSQEMNNPELAAWAEWKKQVAALEHQVDGYKNVQATLDRSIDPKTGQQDSDKPPRFLDLVDDKGHAAISVGDPDLASKSSTFVPGTGQDMAKMDASDLRAAALRQQALDLDPTLGKTDVSVTTWMGYDRPMDIFDPGSDKWAGKPDFALNGAQALDDWQNALRITHDDAAAHGRSFNTVIGHSYGSAEVGAAATHGHHLDADAIAGVGSPGMFANQLSDFNINPGATVYVATADNDMIKAASVGDPFIEPLGPDPRTVKGAYQFQTDPGKEGDDWYTGYLSGDAHSSYFTPGSSGMTSMGQIIIGQTPKHA